MNVAFFTEGNYRGKVPRTNPNMRTDQAWMCALDADHIPIAVTPSKNYDIGIVIIPKEKNREFLANQNYPIVQNLKKYCNQVWVMQESTHWDWQEEPYNSMVWYYSQLVDADGIFCHNDIDKPYFEGITNNPVEILPTLMIEDSVKHLLSITQNKSKAVFVAGNWHTTYRGFDAWVIGNEFDLPMYGFKSGKFKQGEENNGVNYLPWMTWDKFMYELSKVSYAVQTYQASAGQFPLNCAYLGIPCIGYNDINTQKHLYPKLSVDRGDIVTARKLVSKLKTDPEFYQEVSLEGKSNYNSLYSEEAFKNYIQNLNIWKK